MTDEPKPAAFQTDLDKAIGRDPIADMFDGDFRGSRVVPFEGDPEQWAINNIGIPVGSRFLPIKVEGPVLDDDGEAKLGEVVGVAVEFLYVPLGEWMIARASMTPFQLQEAVLLGTLPSRTVVLQFADAAPIAARVEELMAEAFGGQS